MVSNILPVSVLKNIVKRHSSKMAVLQSESSQRKGHDLCQALDLQLN